MPGKSGFLIQFIQLAGPFWNSENKGIIRKKTLALIVLTALQMAIVVITTEWSAALFDALEQRSMSGLIRQIGVAVLILAVNMAVTFMHLKVTRYLQIGWRSWLTERVIGQWMNNGRHYLVTHLQTPGNDNPDGRIAEDIRIATDEAIALSISLFYTLLCLFSFTEILWTLSGTVFLELGGKMPVYGHLVWIAVIYAAGASLLGWWVGRPLTLTTNAMQTAEANFRFGLVKARENSQAIALIHGEVNEQKRFLGLFQGIADVYDLQTHAWANIRLFNSGYSVLSMAFPILVAAPRYIVGSITLGALMQSVQAFQQMTAALSWPVSNLPAIAQWRASVERVLDLVKALDDLEQEIARPDPERILIEKPSQSSLSFHDLCISKFNREPIVCNPVNDEIRPGEHVLIAGDASAGAKLFKAIAGLWPWGRGRIELPNNEPMFFMPPRPYLPDGTLQAAICYPSSPETFSQAMIEEFLKLAGLEELAGQLDQTESWEKALSREQQQRLGLVRLLLYRPKWILLQEAFDSLDPDGEESMLRLICQELPDAAMLTITNQPTAEAFHDRQIVL